MWCSSFHFSMHNKLSPFPGRISMTLPEIIRRLVERFEDSHLRPYGFPGGAHTGAAPPLIHCGVVSLTLASLILLLSSCSPFLPQPTPTSIPIPLTKTAVPSSTPTAGSTSTPPFTPTPQPTNTSTPQPGWVTYFAQPILDAIAEQTPSYQDDFGPGSAGWEKDYCPGSMETVAGELVITNCRVFRPNTDWTDFALAVDMHFLKTTVSSSELALHFRDLGNSGHELILYHNGSLAISFTKAHGNSTRVEFSESVLSDDQTHSILLIAKGNRFALYLDGQPLYYGENNEYLFGRTVFFSEPGAAAIDNLRIWDISKIPIK